MTNHDTYGHSNLYQYQFKGCTNLRNFVFGDSVRVISQQALANITSIKSVIIGNNVDSIGSYAFYGCTNMVIDSLRFPNIRYIGASAFWNCTNMVIDSLRFPNSLKYIGGYAFNDCDSIRYVEVPHTVDTVLPNAFSDCDNLHTVVWNCPSTVLNHYRPGALTMNFNYIGIFEDCNIRNFVFGDSIRIIESYALYGFENIRSVTLGDNINRIDVRRFPVCDTIISRNITPPYLYTSGYNSYEEDLPVDAVVIVPCESVSAYRNSSWNYFTNIVGSMDLGNYNASLTVNNDSYGSVNYNCSNNQLLATANYGCHFVQWSDGNTSNPRTIANINNVSLQAIFAKNVYNVTFSTTSQGTFAGGGQYEYLDTATISVVPNYGYSFVRWNDGDTNATRQVVVTANRTYSAVFNPNPYTINVVSNDTTMGTVSGAGIYNYNTTRTITATPTAYQYCLLQWSDGCTDNPRTVTVLGDTTYYAIFGPKPICTLTTAANNATMGVAIGDTSVLHGTNIQISAVANYGYHFTQWSDGNTQNPRTIQLIKDTLFTAIFAKNTYLLTINVNYSDRGEVTQGSTYLYLDTVQIEATANYGYHFTQWSDGNTDNPRIMQITKDSTLAAVFDKNTYTLTATANNSERGIVIGSGSYEYLYTARVTATANNGYHFTSWSDGSTQSSRSIQMVKDSTITATFEPNNYSVNVAVNGVCAGMGTVTGGGVYPYGTNIQLSATGNYGYRFSQWSDGNTDNPRTYRVDRTITLYASFEPASFNITLASADESMGTVAGGGAYDYRSEAVLKANSKPGYFFSHWNDGNKENPRVVTVSGDMSYTAYFTDTYVGVEEAEVLENLAFYPNPTEGTITFNNQEIKKVEVLDVMGRVVAVHENSYIIDLSNLSNGIYTMRIELPKGVAIRKVILK
jgi:hypothetical protein